MTKTLNSEVVLLQSRLLYFIVATKYDNWKQLYFESKNELVRRK